MYALVWSVPSTSGWYLSVTEARSLGSGHHRSTCGCRSQPESRSKSAPTRDLKVNATARGCLGTWTARRHPQAGTKFPAASRHVLSDDPKEGTCDARSVLESEWRWSRHSSRGVAL